ncbi:bikaverin cluster-transcription factor [Fusarium beomiforme]|uniref:Bikaverin cluster-transcription factor n=1 Tax=Fusarium beomiforme TaxID=44412 RepID=A0A9P5ABJ0_9HYPO|nr:bikaverin cluster-transcription factor [Fusarium beomiforme]
MDSSTPNSSPPGIPEALSASEAAQTPVPSSIPSDPLPLRSCVFCRRRKVKCDRQKPCSNCLRANIECTYPAGRGRAAKRSSRALDTRLVDRLQKLENIIKQLTSQVDATANNSLSATETQASDTSALRDVAAADPSEPNSSNPDALIEKQIGRLMIDDSKSYYVSNILWANLGNEIEELRDMLHDPLSEEEDNFHTNGFTSLPELASPSGTNAAVLGFGALTQSLLSYHPPMSTSVTLLGIFTENVLPLVHVFHMPTTEQLFWDAIVALDSLDRNTECLLFALYYSTVISMDEGQCLTVLGESRSSSLDKFRFAVEQAMARANLLNTQSLILLQAIVLFLSGLRNEDDSRTTWSLTSLVFHIAQAMGLHRDGSTFGLKPFDTELRRRLWWHICLLDMRSSEFHGYQPIVRADMFDTKPPLNINDSDINPQKLEAPTEHEGYTEMTFCLVRCEVMRAGWKVGYASPTPNSASDAVDDRESIVQNLKNKLEHRYLRYCNSPIPIALFTSTVARLMIARTWLAVHYPSRQQDHTSTISNTDREQLFSTSIEILELSTVILTNVSISRWTWHSKTHIQWHAVILVLSEICTRPSSPECDRAWEFVNTVHNRWNMKESGKRGNLWRPIQRLMAKARYVREMQQLDPGYHIARKAAAPGRISTTEMDIHPNFPRPYSTPDVTDPGEYMNWVLGDLGIDIYGGMTDKPSWG